MFCGIAEERPEEEFQRKKDRQEPEALGRSEGWRREGVE
jgi:hypothetical protein